MTRPTLTKNSIEIMDTQSLHIASLQRSVYRLNVLAVMALTGLRPVQFYAVFVTCYSLWSEVMFWSGELERGEISNLCLYTQNSILAPFQRAFTHLVQLHDIFRGRKDETDEDRRAFVLLGAIMETANGAFRGTNLRPYSDWSSEEVYKRFEAYMEEAWDIVQSLREKRQHAKRASEETAMVVSRMGAMQLEEEGGEKKEVENEVADILSDMKNANTTM
jgi:hypothetical protein